jgi:hypothetical protein
MDIIRGKVETASKVIFFGGPGVGKTTAACGAPTPLVIDPSGGSSRLDVARVNVTTWDEVIEAASSLRDNAQGFETLVLDELGTLEHLCWDHVCKKFGKPNIEAFGYGKGYTLVLQEWRKLVEVLNELHHARMNVVLVGHSTISTFRDPEGPEYDRYHLKLHGKLAALLKEWSDTVLFCRHETVVGKTESERSVAHATGARVMHTTHSAAFDAKNRDDLPAKLPLLWAELSQKKRSAKDMAGELEELSGRMSPQHRKIAVAKMKEANGNQDKVRLVLNWARAKAGAKK